MDKKATQPSQSQEKKEEGTSMPASAHGGNTRETQAQTQGSSQPLDYFHIGERTMSPPLEKAMGPSPGSYPDTPAASITSGVSRSSTIDSSISQDSDITLYSQTTSSSDDTISVPRSLSFPAMGSSPLDRNPLPKGASLRVFGLPKALIEGGPVLLNWPGPAPINSHFSLPDGRGERVPSHNSQALPSRHQTFPMERSRTQTNHDDTHSSTLKESGSLTGPDASSMNDQPPKVLPSSVPDMHHNVISQEMLSDEVDLHSLPKETDMFLKGRLSASDRWVVGTLDRKHAGLYCGFATSSSTESFLHYRRRFSRYKPYQAPERTGDVPFRHYEPDRERTRSRSGTTFSAADPLVHTEAVESLPRLGLRIQTDDMRERLSSNSSPQMKPYHDESRESCSPDSDDNTNCPDEFSSPASEDDEDSAYDRLVESITNLVFESSCVGNVEERGVPVELYVHSLLEQILNHQKPATESETMCLPIRSVPKQNNKVPGDAGGPEMRAHGQGGHGGGGGGGGGGGRKKRKSEDTPGHYRDHEDDDEPGYSSEEDHSNNSQQSKKQKTDKKGGNYSCPFRKRNPLRFNVRKHGSCALNSFADMALLKRHIKNSHQKAKGLISCVRCKTTFTNQAALNDHLTQPESCQLLKSTGNEDPEDGITDEVGRALQVRTKDDNIRSWETLWKHLFPNDKSEEIPDPDHEPPFELDEVRKYCYDEDSVREFVRNQPVGDFVSDHGFRYLVECLDECRGTSPDKIPKKRRDQDHAFDLTVRDALWTHAQCGFEAQQTHQPPECAPTQWESAFKEAMPFGNDLDVYSIVPYPSFPAYATHVGFDGSQIPGPDALDPSSDNAAQPAPQNPPMSFAYGAITSSRPCSAAEGSGHRSSAQYSSGPSSQSRDSGDLRTQETQDTQYTQEHDAALHRGHQQLPFPDDGAPGDLGGACSCSTSPGGMPAGPHCCANTASPGQGSSEQNFCGIGEGTLMQQGRQPARANSSLIPAHSLDMSNSDEDLSPFPDIP